MCRPCPCSSWTIPADIHVETWVKNCTGRFYNHSIGMRSYLLASNFKFNLQEHNFVYVIVIIKYYLNFITCLYFPLALITWNSSHCHQIKLFKSKESCKKSRFKQKCTAKNGWMYIWKMLSFVGKHLSFYPKDVC